MPKEYSLLFMLILISIFTITKQGCSGAATKADDCKDDSLSQDDKDDDDLVHCCYFKNEKLNSGFCDSLTSKQYKNLGKYIKQYEKEQGYTYKISIDCKSSYLNLFLLALIMQLLLL